MDLPVRLAHQLQLWPLSSQIDAYVCSFVFVVRCLRDDYDDDGDDGDACQRLCLSLVR